jgi:DNA replication and repair protein RecF
VGKNGMGKTNILDAIYYLSNCKSFFNTIDSQNILHEKDFFVIQGEFNRNKKSEKIYCGVKKGKKKVFKKGKKEYEKLSEHIGFINTVLISPMDTNLIYDGSEVRRKYIDYIISQFNSKYLKNLIDYNKALAQRNALLKHFIESRSFNEQSLEVWNEQLIMYGEKIISERKKFISAFTPIFERIYQSIAQNNETPLLKHKSQLHDKPFADLLKENINRDRYSGYTSVGPHRDDYIFQLNEQVLKKYGSQGQQKTFLISLKLAHYKFIEEKSKQSPILLLDDIYDKLDNERISKLMKAIAKGEYGQVIITDTDTKRLPAFFKKEKYECFTFEINEGELIS